MFTFDLSTARPAWNLDGPALSGHSIHRSIAGYNPYNLFILTIDYSKNFTTNKVLTIGRMSMFVVKSIVIQINSLAYGSINCIHLSIRLIQISTAIT